MFCSLVSVLTAAIIAIISGRADHLAVHVVGVLAFAISGWTIGGVKGDGWRYDATFSKMSSLWHSILLSGGLALAHVDPQPRTMAVSMLGLGLWSIRTYVLTKAERASNFPTTAVAASSMIVLGVWS